MRQIGPVIGRWRSFEGAAKSGKLFQIIWVRHPIESHGFRWSPCGHTRLISKGAAVCLAFLDFVFFVGLGIS